MVFSSSKQSNTGWMKLRLSSLLLVLLAIPAKSFEQKSSEASIVSVGNGWANNSVNVVVFRKNALVTFRDTQFISYYDENRFVVIGKRKFDSPNWEIKRTNLQGNIDDAHNMISMMVDGNGYLHIAWNHHNNSLHYVRSVRPGSLDLTNEMPMTGKSENRVSYPEFYKMPNGNLLFFYRDGQSGQGNLVIDEYDTKYKQWQQLQNNLIDGEGQRNAYWQACVDAKGTIHISWVWRETPDVASNHDLCYARSGDGGRTWETSNGKKYQLPINASNAEYIVRIPQHSELINQTSMCADDAGNPYVATYWRDSSSNIPQYRLLYKKNGEWKMINTGFRKTPFSLSGAGTKRIPISRPQVIAWHANSELFVGMLFRDAERGDKVSFATWNEKMDKSWKIVDLNSTSLGSWEPTYDTELWKEKRRLDVFIENVEQADAEGNVQMKPQRVQVLQWNPMNSRHPASE
jgi:hypothetical protein